MDNPNLTVTAKQLVETYLKMFPEVSWDRWTGEPDRWLGIFGWIDRPTKHYKDYLHLTFHNGILTGLSTSSSTYSAEFAQRLGMQHVNCQRVEDTFDIPNCIRL